MENSGRNSIPYLERDVLITVGEYRFLLQKRLVQKSRYYRELIREQPGEESVFCSFTIQDIPGGARVFKIISKFVLDEEYELTSSNVVPLICGAYHLHMTELISQAEKFLSENVFPEWEKSIDALVSCEEVIKQADKHDIVWNCIKSVAYKVMYNDSVDSYWWHEDICEISIRLFSRLVHVLGARQHDANDISNAVVHYANRYNTGFDPKSSGNWSIDERRLFEKIVPLLPVQKGATSNECLLSMLRAGIMLNANPAGIMLNANPTCIASLEEDIGRQLDEFFLDDLLEPDDQAVTLDTSCIRRIVQHFMDENLAMIEHLCHSDANKHIKKDVDLLRAKIETVGNIIDQYLTISKNLCHSKAGGVSQAGRSDS